MIISKRVLPSLFLLGLGTLVACQPFSGASQSSSSSGSLESVDSQWWRDARTALAEREGLKPARHAAKNVIVFLGDGMGVSTITAARILDGQQRGLPGEENALSFEAFPHLALVKTYNSNQQVADSAGTATAIHAGIKTRAGVLGIHEQARRGNCAESLASGVPVLGELARQRGLGLGIVTTTRVTHATPASVFAHTPERDWESDSQLPENARSEGCPDLAAQLVDFNSDFGIDVVLGGGRKHFLPKDQGGSRLKRDLVAEWRAAGGEYMDTREQLNNAERGSDKPLLGLFADSHLDYRAGHGEAANQPSLAQMTAHAIEKLESRDNGYYLLVEGGRIDHGHHEGVAGKALLETIEFNRAIQKALELVDLDETLVMVTADHSHVISMAGYPTRGNPILGLVHGNDSAGEPATEPTLALDGLPYTTLAYANGPGALRRDPGSRGHPDHGEQARQQAIVPTGMEVYGRQFPVETHAGEDVALYAAGPRAYLVGGVMEQHLIFHIITRALGWN